MRNQRRPSLKSQSFHRRTFLKNAAATAGLVIAPAFLRGMRGDAWAEGTSLFPLGVASGDPDEHSVVLWTRAALDPLAGGGLPNEPIAVGWQVALDPGMRRIVKQGVAVARPEVGHTVRLLVGGLPADQWLYYRFVGQGKYRGQSSRVGRTRTFPHADPLRRFRQSGGEHCRTEDMRFAVASCQHFIAGYYPAWADITAQDLDFVVFVGDYIYEDGSPSPLPGRSHPPVEIFSVADYRNRYALYRLDAHLQDAHARFPFIVTPDDHEVDNNYAGLVAEEGAPYQGAAFAERRKNAYQVYAETMPVRTLLASDGDDFQVFRRLQFGDLADLHVLDTRQFRTDQPAEDGFGTTDADTDPVTAGILEQGVFHEKLFDAAGILDEHATLMGGRQELWLALNLLRSRSKWNVIAQQVMLMPWNLRETGKLVAQAGGAPPQILAAIGTLDNILNMDAWDGYRRARERLLAILGRVRPPSPVVITGDIHSAWAANLFADFGDAANSDVVAVEFVGSSITSTFSTVDPRPTHGAVRAGLPDNPHIRYFNGLYRGYCLCEVDRNEWRTLYRAVGSPADLMDPSQFAFIPMEGDPLFTDAVASIPRGFNRRGEPETLTVEGVVTGAS
ncbi:MAG TPA: alkaline phosphatase D family protein [Gammaproteobacteria bacterium]|nr:alkaline phosphatase D family protein [Gammaproteobacteria bacterium]